VVSPERFEGGERIEATEAFLDVLTKTYLHPERLTRERILDGVVTALPRVVPEIWMRATADELIVEIEHRALAVRCARRGPRWDLVLCLRRVAAAVTALADVSPALVDRHLAESIAGGLDPYTRVMWTPFSSCDFAVLDDCPELNASVGLGLADRGRQVVVAQVLPNSPARRAGIRPGDRLVQVDGLPAEALFAAGASRRLQGDTGSVVLVGVQAPGEVTRVVELRRERIRGGAVQWRRLDDGIGLLRIHSFDRDVARRVAAIVDREAPKGLVLDLRDNPGGVLRDAVRVADLLLDRGVLFTLRGRKKSEPYDARVGGAKVGIPVVVLVNERTASAAELLAGTLQYHGRAEVVGRRTFGKGSVQVPFELPGGFMMATIGHYLIGPSEPVHKRGVAPDRWVALGAGDDVPVTIAVAMLSGAPGPPHVAAPPAFAASLEVSPERVIAGEPMTVRLRIDNLGDTPLEGLSAELTASEPRLGGVRLAVPSVLAGASDQVTATVIAPSSVSRGASELGLQWFHAAGAVQPESSPRAYVQIEPPPAPQIGVHLQMVDGDGVVVPRERMKICVTLTNLGQTELRDGFASIDARRGPVIVIGRPMLRVDALTPGSDARRCVDVVGRPGLQQGRGSVDVVWGEWGGRILGRRTLEIPTARVASAVAAAVMPAAAGWQPFVELAVADGRLTTDARSVRVTGRASAVDGVIRDLALYAGQEKVAYTRGPTLEATVFLELGATELTLEARTELGLIRAHRVRVVRRD